MGYQTEFTGHVTVEPPLNGPEMAFLRQFANSRRYQCSEGPFHVATGGDPNRHVGCQPIATNTAPSGQPGLWCSWVPTDDGLGIEWSGMEKFYDADEWMAYLIDNFLRPDADANVSDDDQFKHFTFNHIVNGRIEAQGEDADDRWTLVVKDNIVSKVPYPTIADRMASSTDLAAAFETLKAAGVTVEQYAKQTGQDY